MSEKFKHGYALIIGVDENNVNDLALPTVAKDVQAIHDVLIRPDRCGYLPENVRLLKGTSATRQNILESLHWLQGKVASDDNATVIVYYSGHGMRDKKTGYSYMIPYDIEDIKQVKQNSIRTESFGFELYLTGANRLLVIIDASLNTNELNKYILSSQQDSVINDTHALGNGMGKAVLCSSNNDQSAHVRKDGLMSIFTYHLIEALTGHATYTNSDNRILVTDIMSWVAREVPKTAEAEGHMQIPAMSTTGVFPIANLLSTENKPIDPLETLSPQFQTYMKDYIEGYFRENPPVTNIYHGDHITQQSVTGDTYNMSGDFRGSNVNVKSTLSNVQQTIGNLPLANDLEKQELKNLVNQLENALGKVPAAQDDDAEAVSQATEILINSASEEKPNQTMLNITSEGLKQAAKNLAAITPEVVTIATSIVMAVGRFSGMV